MRASYARSAVFEVFGPLRQDEPNCATARPPSLGIAAKLPSSLPGMAVANQVLGNTTDRDMIAAL
jgi:hypothetical protein